MLNVGNGSFIHFDASAAYPNDQYFHPDELDAIISDRILASHSPGYFYMQNYTYSGEGTNNVNYNWYLN